MKPHILVGGLRRLHNVHSEAEGYEACGILVVDYRAIYASLWADVVRACTGYQS